MVSNQFDLKKSQEKYQKDREALAALKKRLSVLNLHSSEDEIISVIKELGVARVSNSYWAPAMDESGVNYAFELLNLKQQEKLLNEQRKGSQDLVSSTKMLAYATIALAVFTALLSIEPWLRGK